MENTTPSQQLTFSSFLSLMYNLSQPHWRNQTLFFQGLFASYCKYRSDSLDPYNIWAPAQSAISDLFQGRKAPSSKQYHYYLSANHSALLKDVIAFVNRIAPTPGLQAYFYMELVDFIDAATNIPNCDKDALMDITHLDNNGNSDLVSIVYALLHYLFCLPQNVAIGAE